MMSVPAPAQIEFLAQAVGDEVALNFIEQTAGKRIKVPNRAEGSRIELLYGTDIARAVCLKYSGSYWDVPGCRDWRIRCYLAMGLSVNDIAIRAGISNRSVWRSLKKPYRGQSAIRPRYVDERQATLF